MDALLASAPALEDVYDDEVLTAIDRGLEPATEPGALQRRVASSALVLSLVNGVREAVDADDEDEDLIEIYEAEHGRRLEAVSVHLAWGDPAAGIAIVRPWLL